MALKRIPVPARIDLLDDGRLITFTWSEGRVTKRLAFDLRVECPCALCVDELTGKRILDPNRVATDIRALSFGRIGRYAVQFTWSDGHRTGIYPYERLLDIEEKA